MGIWKVWGNKYANVLKFMPLSQSLMHFQCIFTSSVLNIYRLDVVSAQTPPHISPFNSQPLSAADKDAADKTEVQFVVSAQKQLPRS